tara:strand:- start:1205 stop:1999 length:795 start_codon:yes stop_codon:yes gene_type:complete
MTDKYKDVFWGEVYSNTPFSNWDFEEGPLLIQDSEILNAVSHLSDEDIPAGSKQIRIQCGMNNREQRPEIFKQKSLFLLPYTNSSRMIFKGEGYLDIPKLDDSSIIEFEINPEFKLEASSVGNSEMQHLDYAFAVGIVQDFVNVKNLHLTIRGRKRASFNYKVTGTPMTAKGVQIEVDAGYEGESELLLFEAKNNDVTNEIIRQLFFPKRKWEEDTTKKVRSFFSQYNSDEHSISFFEYGFMDAMEYTSLELVKSGKYLLDNKK